MDISDLTTEMQNFVKSKGWYSTDSKRPQSPKNLAISIAIEASEILEQFQWRENILNKNNLANELADVALYLFQLASITDIDLEQAIKSKLSENHARSWNDPKESE